MFWIGCEDPEKKERCKKKIKDVESLKRVDISLVKTESQPPVVIIEKKRLEKLSASRNNNVMIKRRIYHLNKESEAETQKKELRQE